MDAYMPTAFHHRVGSLAYLHDIKAIKGVRGVQFNYSPE
jgi:hypothetical protein